jgi:hypothetical protein
MNLDHDKEAFAELIAGAAKSSVPDILREVINNNVYKRDHYGTAFCSGEL